MANVFWILVVCVVCGILGVLGLLIAAFTLAKVIGLEKSTHKIEFRPVYPDGSVGSPLEEAVANGEKGLGRSNKEEEFVSQDGMTIAERLYGIQPEESDKIQKEHETF